MSDWDNAPSASGNDWENTTVDDSVVEGSVAATEGSNTATEVAAEPVRVKSPARIIIPVDGPVVGDWTERQPFDYEVYTAERDPEAPRGAPIGQWAASGRRYEWKEEYGDVAPRDEVLERMLFGEPGEEGENMGAGIQFDKFVHPFHYHFVY